MKGLLFRHIEQHHQPAAGEAIVLRITSHFGGEQARDGSQHSLVVKKLRDHGWDIRLKEGTRDYALTAPQEQGEYLLSAQ